jgi:hypothetical protein
MKTEGSRGWLNENKFSASYFLGWQDKEEPSLYRATIKV